MRHVLHAGLIAVAGAVMVVSTGCQSSRNRSNAEARAAATQPGATTMPTTRPAGASGAAAENRPAARPSLFAPLGGRDKMVRGSLAYPTGDARTSAIVLEKAVPAEVVANKGYEYELTVRNVSSGKLENVEIVETLPAGLKLAEKVEGAALSVADGKARIRVGTLNAGETRTLKVGATATAGGSVTNCASVTYDSSLCVGVNVVSPALTMTQQLPADVLVCDRLPFKVVLTNNGTGTARNVKLEESLPEGITTADGKAAINLSLGDITSGESRNVEIPLKLNRPGTFSMTPIATADDGLKAEGSAQVNAHQAVLEVEKSGPKQQYVGVPYNYDIKVTNKGDADANNVVVIDTLPAGVVATEASDGGRIEGGRVTWKLATLGKATAKELKLVVKGNETGTAHNTVSAQADCAATATVSADTNLVGIPAILLEVVDAPDPVMVGGETTFTIIVTNQGSAVATNVKLVSELEQQMEYVSSKGATNGKIEGNRITFEPLATLAPKVKVTYSVVVRAKDAGDVRFKTTLTSDQLGRPVDELESTTFYK